MRVFQTIALFALPIAACSPSGGGTDADELVPQSRLSAAPVTALTVVEIFQSQGCSSCPPANANVNAIAGDPNILALSFAVDYWDRLGWTDRFAKPGFTQRERDYANQGVIRVATPQVVVNGNYGLTGHKADELAMALRKAAPLAEAPNIEVADGTVTIGKGAPASAADVWLVRYDTREQNVPISAGENYGKTLPHRNIVKQLEKLARWEGAALTLQVTRSDDRNVSSAVLLQQADGGPIMAAKRL